MCHIWQRADYSQLPLAAYKKLPASLKYINISGGEPFLRPDLPELAAVIKQTCPQARLIISTNGLLSELIARQVKEIAEKICPLSVAVSLDGLQDVHDQVRGMAGSFAQAVKTIKLLKALGFAKHNLKISFTLNNNNIPELPKVYRLARELGVDFTLAVVHNSDNYFNVHNNPITKLAEVKKVLSWLIKQQLRGWRLKSWLRAYFSCGLWHFIKSRQRLLPDYTGRSSIFIDPRGKIYPSDISAQPLADLTNFNQAGWPQNAPVSEPSWMICTARMAISKHPFKVCFWILKNKFKKHAVLS